MSKKIIFVLLLSSFSRLYAQSFSLSDSIKNIFNTTSSGVVHGYIELTNNVSQKLNLQWVKRQDALFPRDWKVYLQDPQTFYNQLDKVDSGTFFLDSIPNIMDKLIIQIDHKGFAGNGTIAFAVFPINNRNDDYVITFNINISEDASGINKISTFKLFEYNNRKIRYNPEKLKYLTLFNALGQQQHLTIKDQGFAEIECNLPCGIYLIRTETFDNRLNVQKIFINN